MPMTMPASQRSSTRSGGEDSLPTLLPGEHMVHNNRRLEYPPKPIGYERALKAAEDALREDLYDDDFTPVNTPTPASARRNSSVPRPDAPVFTPLKVTDNNKFRVQPVEPRLDPADRYRANNRDVPQDAFDFTPRAENSNGNWEGSDDSGTATPKGPPTWLSKMEILVGTKLKLSPYERKPAESDETPGTNAPQIAVPRHFDSPQPRK